MEPPAHTGPFFDDIVDQHDIHMLKSAGDFSIANGDLALTKDGDFMMGDVAYNALFRIVELWRHNYPHLACLCELTSEMAKRRKEADARLEKAALLQSEEKLATGAFGHSPEFLNAWHAHYGEEGAAVTGRNTYAGCLMLLTSNALSRFKDDLDCPKSDWKNSGKSHNNFSVGQIVVAAANGFRHEDEWAKTRTPTPMQKQSQVVLKSVLGSRSNDESSPPGRCPEVIELLSGGDGFRGFTSSILGFAHEVAVKRRNAMS